MPVWTRLMSSCLFRWSWGKSFCKGKDRRCDLYLIYKSEREIRTSAFGLLTSWLLILSSITRKSFVLFWQAFQTKTGIPMLVDIFPRSIVIVKLDGMVSRAFVMHDPTLSMLFWYVFITAAQMTTPAIRIKREKKYKKEELKRLFKTFE